MIKKIISMCLCLTMLIIGTASVYASDISADEISAETYEFMFSEEVNQFINEEIDFNAYGTQSVEIGNGITFTYINEQSNTRTKVSEIMTSLFTRGEKTLATLRLSCTFTYTGTSVSISDDDYEATAEPIPGFTCTHDESHSTDSSGDVYVSGTYELFEDNNYVINGYMDMSCDKYGNVTKHYPWS